MLFDFDGFLDSFHGLLSRVPITFGIAFFAFFVGSIIGLLVALTRIYKVPVLKSISRFYVSFIRGTPLVVQLYLANYGIARILYWLQTNTEAFANFNASAIKPEWYGMLAFTINLGAYLSETIRASIEAVDVGQFEAAKSIGMTTKQTMLRIVIPQTLKVAIPNLNNTIINTIKDTSLLFTIGIIDMMGQAKIFGARTLSLIEAYVAVSIIYWVTCFILEKIFMHVEEKMKIHDKAIA